MAFLDKKKVTFNIPKMESKNKRSENIVLKKANTSEDKRVQQKKVPKRRKLEPVNSIFLPYKSGNWDSIEAILAVEPLAVNDQDELGFTLLMLEILNVERVKYLLEIGANPHLHCKEGCNAWFYAAEKKAPLEVFQILSEHKVDPNCADENGTTTLIHAIMNYTEGDDPKIKLLLTAGADVKKEDSQGNSAFMLAAVNHSQQSLLNKMLLNSMVQKFYKNVKFENNER